MLCGLFYLSYGIPFSRSVPALIPSGVILNSYVFNLPVICGGASSIVECNLLFGFVLPSF